MPVVLACQGACRASFVTCPGLALLGSAHNRPGTVQPLIPGHALLPPRRSGLPQRAEQVLGGAGSGWTHATDDEIERLVPVACFVSAVLERGAGVVLRSRDPDGVIQEVWAHLLVHYAIRTLMHQAALAAEVDPDRLSFTRSLHIARRQVTSQAAFSPSAAGLGHPAGDR